MGYALWNLPRILTTMVRSLTEQLLGTGAAFAHGQIVAGLVGVIGSVMLLCPMAGVVYLSVKIGGKLLRAAKRSTAGRPRLRLALCVLALAGLTGLSYAWVSGMTPRPLPKKPPIAPILQPGVPTEAPSPRDASTPGHDGHGGPGTGGASVSPSAVPGASASVPGAAVSPGASASASGAELPSSASRPHDAGRADRIRIPPAGVVLRRRHRGSHPAHQPGPRAPGLPDPVGERPRVDDREPHGGAERRLARTGVLLTPHQPHFSGPRGPPEPCTETP